MKSLFLTVALALCSVSATSPVAANDAASGRLDEVLAAQPDTMKVRYKYRNPKETLEFFGIKPGMKVADFLPGPEWYAGILLPYLGENGTYVGADFSMETWADYSRFTDDAEAFLKNREGWVSRFRKGAAGWRKPGDAGIDAFRVSDVKPALEGTMDAVLAIRSFHLPARVEGEVTNMASGVFKALKPGGVFGVVQHRAPEGASDDWASGYNGYVKQSALVRQIEAAGFVLEATSEMNANPKDQPGEGDQVWRLPPSDASGKNAHIGESDRMTLRFRKPA